MEHKSVKKAGQSPSTRNLQTHGHREGQHVGFKKIQKYNNIKLPDGTHRRKLEKIKRTLIRKAKIHQSFRKIQGHEKEEIETGKKRFLSLLEEAQLEKGKLQKKKFIGEKDKEVKEQRNNDNDGGSGEGRTQTAKITSKGIEVPPTSEKDRHSMKTSPTFDGKTSSNKTKTRNSKLERQHLHKSRRSRFVKEESQYEKAKRLREEQVKEAARRKSERRKKELEREKVKKLVTAKTVDGKRKLGNQGIVLLERLKRQLL